MQPKYRYGLIALFFIAFFVITPFIVLFVTGTTYDFHSHRFIKTGSIIANSDPRGATIYVNGKQSRKTSATVRFLLPGDYNITLRKTGYFDWNKHLTVRSQYVTYLANGIKNVVMFFSQPQSIKLAGNVQSAYAGSKRLIYFDDDTLFSADLNSPQSPRQVDLPAAAANSKLQILPSADENYYLLYSDSFYGVFDASSNKIFDISKVVDSLSSAGSQTNGNNFAFDSSGDTLYFLAKANLYQIDWQTAQPKATLAAQNILGYTVQNNYLYLINRNAQGQIQLQAKTKGFAPVTILLGLPAFNSAQIYVTNNNQIFILGDNTLYEVQSTLQQIADYVTYVKIYNSYGVLLYATNNEIDFYDYLHNLNVFITRSSQPVKNPILFTDLGWVFYLNNNKLHAIEIDNRGGQNNYTFAANLSGDAQFFMPPNGDTVFLLSQNELQELKIR